MTRSRQQNRRHRATRTRVAPPRWLITERATYVVFGFATFALLLAARLGIGVKEIVVADAVYVVGVAEALLRGPATGVVGLTRPAASAEASPRFPSGPGHSEGTGAAGAAMPAVRR